MRRPRGMAGAVELPARLPGLSTQVRVAGTERRVARRDGHALPALRHPGQARHLPPGAASPSPRPASWAARPPRRISPREAARLQGLPEWFDFGGQPHAATYKQAGNGVNVGAAYHVFREHILVNEATVAKRAPSWLWRCVSRLPAPTCQWSVTSTRIDHSFVVSDKPPRSQHWTKPSSLQLPGAFELCGFGNSRQTTRQRRLSP